ncbi:DUF6603 domain-containing protein [Streptomyces chartreusis]
MSGNLGDLLVAELRLLLEPLAEAIDNEHARDQFFYDLGLDLAGLPTNPAGQLAEIGQAVIGALDALDGIPLPPRGLEDLGAVLRATSAVRAAVAKVGGLADVIPAGPAPPLDPLQLAAAALNLLVLRYLERRTRFALPLLALLGIVRPPTDEELAPYTVDPGTGRVLRFPQATQVIDFAQIGALLSDPVGALKRCYLRDEPTGARLLASALFPRLDELVATLNGGAYVLDPADLDDSTLGAAGATLASATTMLLLPVGPGRVPGQTHVGAIITLSPADAGGLGLVITPVGELALRAVVGGWTVDSTVRATGGTIALSLSEVVVTGADAQISGSVALERGTSAGPPLRFGGENGTRLEIGTLRLEANLLLAADTPPEVGILAEVGKAALVIAAGDGDGLLARILPPGGVVCEFELGIGYSIRRGVYFKGSARLEARIPVHRSFLGVLDLEMIDLVLSLVGAAGGGEDEEFSMTLTTAVTAGAHLGPLHASVEQIGVDFRLTFPDGGGNVGPGDLSVAFHPPIGAELKLDAAGVTGGGYVLADHTKGRYGGILQLRIADTVAVTAIGLIATKLPDGRRGFSLLVVLTAEFPPIQLGLGFTLNGLGGLFGAHRSMDLGALRAGVRNRGIDSVLFPPDPVGNASRVVRDVEAFFPVTEGRFCVGLMAAIGWGTPTLVKAEIGVIVELPSPVRIALLGRLSVVLPDEDAAVVSLKIAVVGTIDFAARELAIDASIYDSRIAVFGISGDFALRLNYGATPAFAVAIGGFHPRFVAPPGFPELARVQISLTTSDNPRLRLEAYLANTPTTVQAGARLDLYAEANLGVLGRFSAAAWLYFDALVYLLPKLSFIVDLGGGIAIARNGRPFLSAQLVLTLEGPQPVHGYGYVEIDFFGKHRLPIDVTVGPEPPPLVLPPGDPIGALLTALGSAGNWSAQLPGAGGAGLVQLRDLGEVARDLLLVHPCGALAFSQRVAPLDIPIDTFEGAPPPPGAAVLSPQVCIGGLAAAGSEVREAFPAGQFFELSVDERIVGEAFPRFRSGLTGLAVPERVSAPPVAVAGGEGYETAVLNPDSGWPKRHRETYAFDGTTLDVLVGTGAAGRAPARTTGAAGFTGAPLGIAVAEKSYRLAGTTDLAASAGSFATAAEADLVRGGNAGLQVVGAHEVGP